MILLLLLLQVPVAHYRYDSTFALPDTLATPGVIATTDTAVICHRHTGTIRAVTPAMHHAIFAAYNIPWIRHARYEDDHLIPLELGGANDNANRWPQPLREAKVKDVVENWAHREVCAGRLNLAEAQRLIARDWVQLYHRRTP